MSKNNFSDSEVLELLETWFEALKACRDPDKATSLYAADAILVPTLWNGPCFGRKAIRNYFEAEFLPVHPEGFLINYAISRMDDIIVNSGHYVFEINDVAEEDNCHHKNGRSDKRVKKHARYTFVYRRDADGWPIVAHHSSKMPEEHSAKAIRWIKSDCMIGGDT